MGVTIIYGGEKKQVGAAFSRDLVSSDLRVNLQLLGGLVLKFGT